MGSDAAEAQQWLSRAAAQGSAQARKLLAQAEKIKNDEQAQYQAREQARKDWERWMQSTPSPYYWHWGHHGWQRYSCALVPCAPMCIASPYSLCFDL